MNFSVQQAEPPALVYLSKLRSWVCKTSPGAFGGLRHVLLEKRRPGLQINIIQGEELIQSASSVDSSRV